MALLIFEPLIKWLFDAAVIIIEIDIIPPIRIDIMVSGMYNL